MSKDPILLLLSQSLDVKLLTNKFQIQLTDVFHYVNFQITNSNLWSSILNCAKEFTCIKYERGKTELISNTANFSSCLINT
jgi:hypothetical protein